MSRPRRPRFRFIESDESATNCSSLSTNCGMTSVPSMKPVSQMSAPAVALHRIRRIGDELPRLEHELRDDERAVHEARLADVGDAAVDDDARVEHAIAAARTRVAEEADDALGLQPLGVARAHDQADVGQAKQNQAVQEDDAVVVDVRPVERRADRLRRAKADSATEQAAEHVRHGDMLQTLLEKDHQRAEADADSETFKRFVTQRLQLIGRVADLKEKKKPREHRPHHTIPRVYDRMTLPQ